MSRLILLMLPFCLLFCITNNANSCSCGVLTPTGYFNNAHTVFSGQATSVWAPKEVTDSFTTTFQVIDTYKGSANKTATVEIGDLFDTCGTRFQPGQFYLIFARNSGDLLRTNSCSGNESLPNAAHVFLELGLGPLPDFSQYTPPQVIQETTPSDADFNKDNEVNFPDFLLFANAFGSEHGIFDLNYDGKVNFPDFLRFVSLLGQEAESQKATTFKISDTDNIDFVFIEPGSFTMGTTSEQQTFWEHLSAWLTDEFGSEIPAHTVTISKGFYLSKYEITQFQWQAIVGTAPWVGQDWVQEGPDYPATYISWGDTQVFLQKINETVGDSLFRLPTEAEWEYACRAKTITPWWFGSDDSELGEYAWYKKNTFDQGENFAHRVGTKKPNPWGLYDMLGNASEWVQDSYHDQAYTATLRTDPVVHLSQSIYSSHIVRGGHYSWKAGLNRPSLRYPIRDPQKNEGLPGTGFRILLIAK